MPSAARVTTQFEEVTKGYSISLQRPTPAETRQLALKLHRVAVKLAATLSGAQDLLLLLEANDWKSFAMALGVWKLDGDRRTPLRPFVPVACHLPCELQNQACSIQQSLATTKHTIISTSLVSLAPRWAATYSSCCFGEGTPRVRRVQLEEVTEGAASPASRFRLRSRCSWRGLSQGLVAAALRSSLQQPGIDVM